MDKQYNDEEEILREGWEKRWKQFLKAHDDFETIKNKVCSSLKGHIYITFFRGIFSNERYCCKQNPAAVWIEHQLLLKENNITKAMEERGGDLQYMNVSVTTRHVSNENLYNVPFAQDHLRGFEEMMKCCIQYKGLTMFVIQFRKVNCNAKKKKKHKNCRTRFFILLYELNEYWWMDDYEFARWDLPTWIMDIAGEYELVERELKFYRAKMRTTYMELAVIDVPGQIDFVFYDNKTIEKKLKMYMEKDYTLENVAKGLACPYVKSIRQFFEMMSMKGALEGDTIIGNSQYNKDWTTRVYIQNALTKELKNRQLVDVTVRVHKREIKVERQKGAIKIEIPTRSSHLIVYPCWQKKLRSVSFNMRSVSIKAMVSFIQKMPETNDKLVEVLTPALIKYRQMTSRHDQ